MPFVILNSGPVVTPVGHRPLCFTVGTGVIVHEPETATCVVNTEADTPRPAPKPRKPKG